MKTTARVLRYIAFGLMAALVTFGALFVAGYAFEDVGGMKAVGLVALWLVPLLVLTVVVRWWEAGAVWVLAVALAAVGFCWAWYAVDVTGWRDLMDNVGPVLGIATFVLALPMATLGLRRPLAAGLMLVGLAVVQYGAFVASVSGEPWRGIGSSLTTSSTVMVLPEVVIGLLFLVAWLFGRLGAEATVVPSAPAPKPPVGAGTPGT